MRIIGLLSTPEFLDANGRAISDTFGVNYTSNHVVAYVRAISGLAAESRRRIIRSCARTP